MQRTFAKVDITFFTFKDTVIKVICILFRVVIGIEITCLYTPGRCWSGNTGDTMFETSKKI